MPEAWWCDSCGLWRSSRGVAKGEAPVMLCAPCALAGPCSVKLGCGGECALPEGHEADHRCVGDYEEPGSCPA